MAYERTKNAVPSSTPGAKPSLVPQPAGGNATNVKVDRVKVGKTPDKSKKVYNGTAIYPGTPGECDC